MRYVLVHKLGTCPMAQEEEGSKPQATTSKAAAPKKPVPFAPSAAEGSSCASGPSAAEKLAKAQQLKLKKEAQQKQGPPQNPEPQKSQQPSNRWSSMPNSETDEEVGPTRAKVARPKQKQLSASAAGPIIASAPWRKPAQQPEPEQPSAAPAEEEARPASGNLDLESGNLRDAKKEPPPSPEYDFDEVPPLERKRTEEGISGDDTDQEDDKEPAPELQRPPGLRKLVQQLGSAAEMAGLPAANQAALRKIFEEMKLEVQSLLAPAAAAAQKIAMKGLRLTDVDPVLAQLICLSTSRLL